MPLSSGSAGICRDLAPSIHDNAPGTRTELREQYNRPKLLVEQEDEGTRTLAVFIPAGPLAKTRVGECRSRA